MEKLPPIRFANGQHLDTTLTTSRSGVNRILFSDDSDRVKERVSYNQSEPGETSIIRKPIIALELARYGLVASHFVETRATAGLLTPRIDTRRGRPSLHFIDGNKAEFLNPAHEKYYDIVPNRELPYLYPLEKPSRPIDIHTSYRP